MSSPVFRKLAPEQSAVLPGSSRWRHRGQGAELRQPGPHPVHALQPGPPEEDLLLRGGPQQGTIWARTGPGWSSLPWIQSRCLHSPFQPADHEPLPPQPRTDARVSGAAAGRVGCWWQLSERTESDAGKPAGLTPAAAAGQLRYWLHLKPAGQVSPVKRHLILLHLSNNIAFIIARAENRLKWDPLFIS